MLPLDLARFRRSVCDNAVVARARIIELPSGNGRSARSSGREQEILSAAIEIFHANGYAATSVEDVANMVGILKGSLYYYIDSKEDLLQRIVEDVHRDVQALIDEAVNGKEGSTLDRLAAYVRAQVEFNARNVKRVRVYYHDYEQLSGPRLAEVRTRRRAQEQAIIGLLQQAKSAGELPDSLNERLASKMLFSIIVWMYTWYKPGGSVSGRELGEYCAEFALGGLLREPGGGTSAKRNAPKRVPTKRAATKRVATKRA